MDYNFQNESQLRIPKEAYRPYKRCEFCQSVYLTDNLCEACGRSVRYDLIGPAFGYKSFYGIKERYLNELPSLVKSYPIFENTQTNQAKSLVRHLKKRLGDISSLIEHDDKKLFDVEAFEIINDLLFYGVPTQVIQSHLNNNLEYERYLLLASQNITAKKPWIEDVLSYRLAGTLRVKFVLATTTILVFFFISLIASLQSGK